MMLQRICCADLKKRMVLILCRELLHYDLSIENERLKAIELDLFKTFCSQMVKSAIQITYDLLSEK